MSKGGFRAFRGSAATAESYLLERDADRLDDYYREGKERTVEHGVIGADGVQMGALTPEQFRAWMEHRDPETDAVRGVFRQRTDVDPVTGETKIGGTPLYQETIISVDKTLSLAAAGNPRVAAALEAAMSRACTAAGEAVSKHAVTRVGDIGKQRQVKLERIEFTSVQHTTSRTGDPHYHRHMQILPVGFAEGRWRALDGRTLYRLAERVNAAADLALSTDMELRQVLAAEGLTWEPAQGGGRIAEYAHLVDAHSVRGAQIAVNREALELEWRIAHPGQEPGPRQRQAWDTHAWAQERPSKQPDNDLTPEGLARSVGEVIPQNIDRTLYGQTAEQIDPAVIGAGALEDLGQQRSAWSFADVEAAVDRRLAQTYLISSEGVTELRQAAIDTAMQRSVSFLDPGVNVEGVRHYTSDQVLVTDRQLTDALTARAIVPGDAGTVDAQRDGFTLSAEQQTAAEAIAGTHELVVIQGAAGAGKTTMLEAAGEALEAQGRRLVVVSPTKRGALEAGAVLGVDGQSVHALLYRAGAVVDENGRWVLPERWRAQPEGARLDEHAVLVVDEAGMLDQDTAAALHAYVDDMRLGTLVLSGDAAQLAAVGRGGYLARAAQLAGVSLDLTDVRRFRTPEGEVDAAYAELSLKMRDRDDPETIFDELAARGLVRVGTLDEQLERIADTVALEEQHGTESVVIAPTNAAAQQINHAVFERLRDAELLDTSTLAYGRDGDPIAAGARVATRENDTELGVANRQTWTVKHVNADGRITVTDPNTGYHRTLDAAYVSENVQLAYAVTGHGAQGMTVDTAHTVLSDELTASGAYVGLTRGRHSNVLHVVGYDYADAREQFVEAFNRDDADLGLEAAKEQVQRDIQGLDISDDRARITEETRRLRDEATQHEHEAERASEQADIIEHRIAEYTDRAEPVTTAHEAAAREAGHRVEAAKQQANEWEVYTAQLEAARREQAHRDGTPVVKTRAQADDAQQAVYRAGRLSKRGAQRDADARAAEWQAHRDEVAEQWGDAPDRFNLEAWATRAAAHHPEVIEAKTNSSQAHEYVTQTERERRELNREQQQEIGELRRDVLGTKQNVVGKRVPLDERTAAEWARQHRENAAHHHNIAGQARTEADTLDRLPTAEAEQRIDARETAQQEHAAELTRTEQVLAEMRARQAAQQEQTRGHDRGIGY